MEKRVIPELVRMTRQLDSVKFSQFTIDWIEELHEEESGARPDTENHALAYNIDILVDVLRYGKDRDFFMMLQSYVRFFNEAHPAAPGTL